MCEYNLGFSKQLAFSATRIRSITVESNGEKSTVGGCLSVLRVLSELASECFFLKI